MTQRSVAIVGAGPSGLYAAKAILDGAQAAGVEPEIVLVDRLPDAFGLLRYGVAPDHTSFQRVREILQAVLDDPRVTFRGGVALGRDVSRAELTGRFDAVVYAVGAPVDVALGIAGEDLPGVLTAGEVVGWYTGHPEAAPVDLAGVRAAVIVGVGNVALDLARLLAAPAGHLAGTPSPAAAQAVLDAKQVTDVWILGRRGPEQAAFTTPELREIAGLASVELILRNASATECAARAAELAGDKSVDRHVRQNLKALGELGHDHPAGTARCRVHLSFWSRPVELLAGADGRLARVVVERTALVDGRLAGTGERLEIPAQLIVSAIGYRGRALPDVPFDAASGVIPSVDGGRVTDGVGGPVLPGEYVVGWAKRGATGIIGAAKADATETAGKVLADLAAPARAAG